MRKLVLSMGVSLDGMVAQPRRSGAGGWGLPKVVFSSTLQRADWPETRIASGDLATEVATLKREPGNEMFAWGGAAFAQSLSRLGLVDEYRLILLPVALGDGLPLFKDLSEPVRLELVDAQTFESGALLHTYRPTAAAS